MNNRTIGEVMDAVHNASGRLAKAEIIKTNNTNPILIFLEMAFGNKTWAYENRDLPHLNLEDPPPGLAENNFAAELRRMYIFEKDSHVSAKKQDEILIQIVESLSKTEADLVIAMVSGKKIPVNGLTLKLVQDLFSGKV